MKKVIVMVKKGYTNITLMQGEYTDGSRYYVVETQGVTLSLSGALALNNAYRQYQALGYQVKPDAPKKEEPKLSAPKEQKVQKPHWEFPNGEFNRSEYIRIATEKRWTFCDSVGKIHVVKKHREEIYVLMGGKYVE